MKPYFITLIVFALILTACGSESDQKTDLETINPPSSSNTTQSSSRQSIQISEDLSLDNSEIVETPYDRLSESLAAQLSQRGKSVGTINSDGSIYFIGAASTGVPSNRSGFINSRNIAFAKAELQAKMELLRLSGEQITSERNMSLVQRNIQGTDPDAVKKASIIEKALKVVDASLDRAMEELGISRAEIASMNQEQKEKRFNDEFYSYVSSYVASMVRGVAVIKVVEGEVGSNDYQVAVAIKYSPEQQNEAANFENLGASQSTMNSNVVNSIKSLPAEQLVSKLGAQLFKDENGNRFILGFGQSAVQQSDSRQSQMINMARSKARLDAVENIKNFLAEDLVAQEISENVEKVTEFMDGTESLYTEDNFSQLIESRRSTVTMNTMKIRDWDSVHPVSNTRVVGTIVILTESNAVNFNTASNSAGSGSETTEQSEYFESSALEGEDW